MLCVCGCNVRGSKITFLADENVKSSCVQAFYTDGNNVPVFSVLTNLDVGIHACRNRTRLDGDGYIMLSAASSIRILLLCNINIIFTLFYLLLSVENGFRTNLMNEIYRVLRVPHTECSVSQRGWAEECMQLFDE